VLAAKEGGVWVLRNSPTGPKILSKVGVTKLGGLHAMNLKLGGSKAYVALGDHFASGGSRFGLAVVDLDDPAHPKVLGSWTSEAKGNGASDVLVAGDKAYLAAMADGVLEFDVSNPARPWVIRQIKLDPDFPRKSPNRVQRPNARGLAIANGALFVANDAGGLRTVALGSSIELDKYVNPKMAHRQQAYNAVAVSGRFAYVSADYAGLEVVDVFLDPLLPAGWWNPWRADVATNGWLASPGHANELVFDPDKRLIYLSAGDAELQIVDVSDPTRPVSKPGYGGRKDGLGSWGLEVAGGVAYVTYIKALIPFKGTWAGIKAIRL